MHSTYLNNRNSNLNTKIDDLLAMPDVPAHEQSFYNQPGITTGKPSNFMQNGNYDGSSQSCNRDPILNDILNAVQSLKGDYARLENKLDQTLNIIKAQEAKIGTLNTKINQQNITIDILSKKNAALNFELNKISNEMRSTSLVFSGDLLKIPDDNIPTSIASSVQQVCQNEVNVTVPSSSISYCKPLISKNGKKSVLMTFSNMEIKEQVLSKIIQLKKDGLYANEYLTKTNADLLYQLRQIKKTTGASFSTFTRGGIPCYRFEGQHEKLHRVFGPDDVEKLKKRAQGGPTMNLRSRRIN